MRLSEIRYVLLNNIDKLEINTQSINNSPNITVSNYKEAILATQQIRNTGILQDRTYNILAVNEICNSVSDEIVVHAKTASSFYKNMTELRNDAIVLANALAEHYGDIEDDSVCIKLPSSSDIDKIIKYMSQLKMALDQALINPSINGHIELIGFERGTNWIEITVGGMIAMKFLAGMIQLIYDSRNKEVELEVKRKMIRDLEVQSEAKQVILDAINKELESHFAKNLDNLYSIAAMDKPEPEYSARLTHSLRLLSELISEGLEVHPSLLPQNQQTVHFPDPVKLIETLRALPTGLEVDASNIDDVDSTANSQMS